MITTLLKKYFQLISVLLKEACVQRGGREGGKEGGREGTHF